MLNGSDIEGYLGRRKKDFVGVFSRDEVGELAGKLQQAPTGSAVINMDDSAGQGTHWVAVRKRKSGRVDYFDSFGAVPPKEVIQAFGDKPLYFSDDVYQSLDAVDCGVWVIKFILGKGT
jgi:hypothetical protein